MGKHTGYVDGILFAEAGLKAPGRQKILHPVNVRVCRRCGSLVALEDEHDVWHASLDRIAHSAQHADSMLRPLGGGQR
jgi:hypothetical protein